MRTGAVPLKIAQREPQVGDPIFLLHYPGGGPRMVSEDPNDCKITAISTDQPGDFLHTCDTVGGSSGAPIISATTLQVVGMHYGKAGNIPSFVNRGKSISAILRVSRTLNTQQLQQ